MIDRSKNLDAVLMAALDPIFPSRAYPVEYTGEELEYIVWNYDQIGAVYAEGKPDVSRYLIQVHYFLPNGKNPNPGKTLIAAALSVAGCTWPDITNANDKSGQHYVLECEFANGGLVHGLS